MIDFSQVITKEEIDKEAQVLVKARIADRRYLAETGGILVNDMQIDTGRDSQAMITGAALSALIDDTYVCRWKTPTGFVTLNASTLLSVSQAMRRHVQACFDREDELVTAVSDGTFTDAMLEEGWPA